MKAGTAILSALAAADLAELERFRLIAKNGDEDGGAAASLGPVDRVNRIQNLATGLAAAFDLLETASHAPEEHQTGPGTMGPLCFMLALVARDIGHEASALWDHAGPALKALREVAP